MTSVGRSRSWPQYDIEPNISKTSWDAISQQLLINYQIVCCAVARSAILATAWILVLSVSHIFLRDGERKRIGDNRPHTVVSLLKQKLSTTEALAVMYINFFWKCCITETDMITTDQSLLNETDMWPSMTLIDPELISIASCCWEILSVQWSIHNSYITNY